MRSAVVPELVPETQWRLRSGPPAPPPIRSIEIFNAPAPPWTPPRSCSLMLRPSLRDSFMARYSAFSLLANAFTGNRRWERVWRSPAPKPAYDAVIVGGGGHGLATAYYLAKNHGIANVAVLEKGWLGSGNIGRNTTIVRSNYLLPPNTRFYEHSMKLWEGLSQDLNRSEEHTSELQSLMRSSYAVFCLK